MSVNIRHVASALLLTTSAAWAVDALAGTTLLGFSPESFITLHDPDRTLGFAVVADGATYLGSTLKLPRSRGFEGMALSANPQFLYALLEGAHTPDSEPRRLIINQFDLQKRAYTERSWAYKRDDASHAIGNFTAVSRHLLLVIERDGGQGLTAKFKKIFKVDLRRSDAEGFLHKEEVVDLLPIADPDHRGGHGTVNGVFSFPFVTIEDVLPLGERKLLVINDNNYRFSTGRAAGMPDDNEFILIRLARPLATDEDEDDED